MNALRFRVLWLAGVAIALAAVDEAPLEPEPLEAQDEAIPESIAVLYDALHFARCSESPSVMLNEICAVGTECDEDVRVADFVEVYNPSPRQVDLRCFALEAADGSLFLPRSLLGGGQWRAFGEGDLGFRIRKAGDRIRLLKLSTDPSGAPRLVELEAVPVDADRAHSFRSPDGGPWIHLGVDAAETGFPGTYGGANAER